ncbi:DUF1893 domain-containing protein [uncultured Bifidobacterium sp.]|uniref:DUF1893 domain-containing protein n=1 Tax=uncultured Bifidobacterium sp. TaxID=165187 RepID=UPI00259747E9|nr:DUF1893 domain-containing protein [uncultured Bifidobacterium sp.]
MTMHDDWMRARRTLKADDALGCVACRGDETLSGAGRGVKPLLAWLAAGQRLDGFSASDRVVGKAAAMLYIQLGAVAVHGHVMSEAGLAMLRSHHVEAACDELVPMIRNRANTGMCPIEQSVRGIDDPAQAETPIRAAVAELMAARS